jgi:dipeptidyl-peptidase-4
VYGGPHAQLVTDSWLAGGGLFLNYLAQRGYVIFTLDNRGSDNRGKAFEQIIYRNVGVAEMADQLKGVEYLKSLDFVDENKIGVDGWSYGGFMTMTLMLKNPGVFKVGCAGGPVVDWKLYEVMYGERYMDKPQDNPDGYENANLLNYVDSLQDKLMIIHCTHDPVVMWQNSLHFIEKAISKGKQLDYFVYPGHKHNVSGLDRMHLYEKIHQYFDDFLK